MSNNKFQFHLNSTYGQPKSDFGILLLLLINNHPFNESKSVKQILL